MNGAHGFRSRNHPKEMALIVEFLKGRVILFPGSEAFLSRSGNFLSRSRSFALFYFTFGDNSRRRGSSFPIFSI